MFVQLQTLATATGPVIDEKRFDNWPPLSLIFLVSLLFAFIIMRWGAKITRADSKAADTTINVIALFFVASAAASLASAPRTQGLLSFIQELEGSLRNGFARWGASFGISALALVLVVIAAAWYLRAESIASAVVFGLLFLVLCNSSPAVSQAIAWFINNVVSIANNGGVGIANWLYQR